MQYQVSITTFRFITCSVKVCDLGWIDTRFNDSFAQFIWWRSEFNSVCASNHQQFVSFKSKTTSKCYQIRLKYLFEFDLSTAYISTWFICIQFRCCNRGVKKTILIDLFSVVFIILILVFSLHFPTKCCEICPV